MIYIEQKDGSFAFGSTFIPNNKGNYHYLEMRARVEAGDATITPFDHDAEAARVSVVEEKNWVSTELARSDVELAYVQDSDTRAVGTVGEWREYRRKLRNYVISDVVIGVRPVSPREA